VALPEVSPDVSVTGDRGVLEGGDGDIAVLCDVDCSLEDDPVEGVLFWAGETDEVGKFRLGSCPGKVSLSIGSPAAAHSTNITAEKK